MKCEYCNNPATWLASKDGSPWHICNRHEKLRKQAIFGMLKNADVIDYDWVDLLILTLDAEDELDESPR